MRDNASLRRNAQGPQELVRQQVLHLGVHKPAVEGRIAILAEEQFGARLWRRDPSLWKSDPQSQDDIRKSLGWLHVAERMTEDGHLERIQKFVAEVNKAGFRHVVHMGMGGSSLASLVLERSCPRSQNGLPLAVLDSTAPETILHLEHTLPLDDTLFIMASKSGATAEPLAFFDYFFDRVTASKGDRAGQNFVAITDPGTPLVNLARERRFRRTFLNFADIGGRYSALSYFGLLPAALAGVAVEDLLARALHMVHACASSVPLDQNPGIVLGAAIGEMARRGHDKLTFVLSPPVQTLGLWLEQLIAESTGKQGTGILPVAGERLGDPSVYGDDRVFVHIGLKEDIDAPLERGVTALRDAGQPVITIRMDDPLDLGQEFVRWQIATATAGATIGINPFDQPNVRESKEHTDRLLNYIRQRGQLPQEEPALTEAPLSVYNSKTATSVSDVLAGLLDQARPGDYVALMAYLPETPTTESLLQAIRLRLRDSLRMATTLGYGPRLLHSTGQIHKGSPNNGLFIQLTADHAQDAPVPGAPYTFGMLVQAQALGDLESLRSHGRRIVRVHMAADLNQGLKVLSEAVEAAIAKHIKAA